MLKLKKWQRVTHKETGISLEVGRLTYKQRPLLAVMVADMYGSVAGLRGHDGSAKDGLSVSETTAAVRGAFEKLDGEMIKDLFDHRVQNVEGLETEDGPITTGPELLDLADQDILMWVLTELVAHSTMTSEQGKASASPSTSPPETTPDSDSPAGSIESAGGASPSTAEETQDESASSSQVA